MKEKFALAVVLAALSGAAFAAGSSMGSGQEPNATGHESTMGGQGSTLGGQGGALSGQTCNTDQLFGQLDADHDGYVSKKELDKGFSQADSKQQGKLDQAEFAQFITQEGGMGTSHEGTSQEGTSGMSHGKTSGEHTSE